MNKNKISIHKSFYFTLPHLQITFSTDEYENLIATYGTYLYQASYDDEYETAYLTKLPEYIIARCPICGASFHSKVDTHSLNPNIEHRDRDYLIRPDYQNTVCMHFVAVTFFINLNGHLPTEYDHWASERGDVPVIIPTLLPDELDAFVVMHSLPICRIESGAFTPRYSIYFLTYYAANPEIVRERLYKELQEIVERNDDSDILTFMNGSESALYNPIIRDLKYWANKNKIYWLDLHSRELPLQRGSAVNFPYANIMGCGKRYGYRRTPRFPWERWFYPNGRIYC